ncbi:MAG: hypothetical protein IPK10_09055 [Bacteroidetes bacterium]|nr:hypothetical protein [Bacteroidota bacterium]
MKKHLFTLFLSLIFMVPMGLNAQTTEGVAKGKRGGYIIGEEQQINFEVVTNGSTLKFYPCSADGVSLTEAPAVADITIIAIETSQKLTQNEIPLKDGSFTMEYNLDYPIYMYAVSYTMNGKTDTVKFRVPGAQAR